MRTTKLLWVLIYDAGDRDRLVFLYAENEQGAWMEAEQWSMRHSTPLPHNAKLVCFPKGFKICMRELPGTIQQDHE